MGQPAETLNRFFDAINRLDLAAVESWLDPQVVRVEPEGFPTSGTYRGAPEVMKHIAGGRNTWAEGSCDPELFLSRGDRHVVFLSVRVRLRDSGEWVKGQFADAFVLRNGKILEYRTFGHRTDALTWADLGDPGLSAVLDRIRGYLASLQEPKRSDLGALHRAILAVEPDAKLWFLDGKDETGRVVTNPNIGYGLQIKEYADGTGKEFYRVGISANTTGISVYILGIADKTYLARTYTGLGKATITGYCIKFRRLADIDLDVLLGAIRDHLV